MPLNIEVTQFPGGIGTVGDASVLNGVASPLPVGGSVEVEDFTGGSNFLAAWTPVNIAGGVASTLPLLSSSGILQITTTGTPGDGVSLEADAAANLVDGHQIQAGVSSFIAARLEIRDPVVDEWLLGFVPGGSGVTPTDGVYLFCAAGSGDVNIIVENNATAQETQLVGTLAAGATGQIDVALAWDGLVASAQFPGGGGSFIPQVANLPAVGLNATIAVVEGAGGATTFDVDWIAFGGGR